MSLLFLHLYHHLKFTINRENEKKFQTEKSTEKNKFKISKKRIFEYKRKERKKKRNVYKLIQIQIQELCNVIMSFTETFIHIIQTILLSFFFLVFMFLKFI